MRSAPEGTGLEYDPALAVTIAICLMIGLLNGILIQYGKIPEFIATLGTMEMGRGLAMLITQGRTIPSLPQSFTSFAQLSIFGLPSLFIVWLVVIIIAAYILKYTRLAETYMRWAATRRRPGSAA